MNPWLIISTIAIPWLGAVCLWLIGEGRTRLLHILAACFSIAGALATLSLFPFASSQPALSLDMGPVFGVLTLVPAGLGLNLAAIAAVVGSLTVIYSAAYMEHGEQLNRYYALVLIFIGAMVGLVLSGSLLWMFFFWEITAFCSYALISFHNDDPKAVAGGIKALLITSLGGVGLLLGALLARAYLGDYQVSTFLAQAGTLPPNVLALVAFGFLAAAAAKSAQMPFHTWLPDAMEAPTPISALIHAATMVNAGVYLLARFYPAFQDVPAWATAVMVVGCLSALSAGVMALVSNDLKRTLAYSTISQLGYMVYAVGTGAVFASQFHLLSHAIFKALLFLGAGVVITAVGTRDMLRMGGLGARMPFTRLIFIIGTLALAGIPITNGFFSKELILEGGLEHGIPWIYYAMLAGVLLTALYSIRMVALVFYGQARGDAPSHDGWFPMRVPLAILALGVLTSWLLAAPLEEMLSAGYQEYTGVFTLAGEILVAPATWLAQLVIVVGVLVWIFRDRYQGLNRSLADSVHALVANLGFDRLNALVVSAFGKSAKALATLQTGQLNWNILGMLAGLVILILILQGA
jgi:NADH-quinone oxidoreductase subunit L